MIRKLKHKMMGTIMFFVTIIISVFVITINVIPSRTAYNEAISFLNRITLPREDMLKNTTDVTSDKISLDKNKLASSSSALQDEPKKPFDDAMLYHSNRITIYLDDKGNVTNWESNREDLYTEETIKGLADTIYEKGKNEGTLSEYYYVFHSTNDHKMIALLDNKIAFHNFRVTLISTIFAGILVWILLFVLSAGVVNRMTFPIEEALEKQKQFVSDAGHELKTPVAVISANADVLSKEVGESKWISYIKKETVQMDNLIRNLMKLAQLDDPKKEYAQTLINLSQTVLGASLPLESLAFENGTIMEFDVDSEIYVIGNKEQLEQLVTILISNALKYGEERGLIKISLHRKHKSAILSVFNTGCGISPKEIDKIFDRFYRVEKERGRKEGSYGLGLAIAHAIVSDHNGKIYAESEPGHNATFCVELSVKRAGISN